jgi:hypothetical protein
MDRRPRGNAMRAGGSFIFCVVTPFKPRDDDDDPIVIDGCRAEYKYVV